jgi:hypothetical protein
VSIISVQELLALLLVAGKAVVASKAVSAELLLVASKKDSAELLLASGLINVCKELDSSLSTIIFSTSTSSISSLAVEEVSAELMLVAGKARSLCRTEVDEKEASGLINVCKELDSSSMLLILRADSPFPSISSLAVEEDEDCTKQTPLSSAMLGCCGPFPTLLHIFEDAGCTELDCCLQAAQSQATVFCSSSPTQVARNFPLTQTFLFSISKLP